ncbi:predicted protein [Histoplasma capsulatum var. duboisii H88]|uniref:Predicted protein n=1 Tax=Ajellomyces capsulatus (strain H88) TaxID=544711 RepID=F0UH94_AJEC8|nr:predicted protein [Histoplasma capsulatum var. duboisii H88]
MPFLATRLELQIGKFQCPPLLANDWVLVTVRSAAPELIPKEYLPTGLPWSRRKPLNIGCNWLLFLATFGQTSSLLLFTVWIPAVELWNETFAHDTNFKEQIM